MKKRLFCLLVAIAMLSSSIAAYATEPEKRATTEGEGSEKGADESEEDGIREAENTRCYSRNQRRGGSGAGRDKDT